MARHYSAKDFFRQMPNALLARYFHGRGVFDDLDFAAMKEGKPDELFAAWLDLPEEQRNATDAEFRDIFEMSCEKGFRAIIDEARWRMRAKPEALTSFIETGPIPISAQPLLDDRLRAFVQTRPSTHQQGKGRDPLASGPAHCTHRHASLLPGAGRRAKGATGGHR